MKIPLLEPTYGKACRWRCRAVAMLVFFLALLTLRVFYTCSPYLCGHPGVIGSTAGYRSSAGNLQQDGQRSNDRSKTLILASLKNENTSWTEEHLPDWDSNVYVVDDPRAELTVEENKGRESMAYLTYIIDNYANLPETMVFLHASRWQWHNEDPMYDGVPVLRRLQLPHVQEAGFANLRCTWNLGCPTGIRPGKWISKLEAALEPHNDRANTEAVFPCAFRELFGDIGVPSAVGVPCGGQFAVARWKVLQQPRWSYERYREWLLNTTLPDSVSGRVFEYSWHMLFGMEPILCPSAEECFCIKFGLCNLTCADHASCDGRYMMPRGTQIPLDWPEVGPGQPGLPDWGWDKT